MIWVILINFSKSQNRSQKVSALEYSKVIRVTLQHGIVYGYVSGAERGVVTGFMRLNMRGTEGQDHLYIPRISGS